MRRSVVAAAAAALVAVPLLAACSGSANDDVRAAASTFLTDWSKGRLAAAAGDTTDRAAAQTLLKQTATDLPGAKLASKVGRVAVNGGSANGAWTATGHLAGAGFHPVMLLPGQHEIRAEHAIGQFTGSADAVANGSRRHPRERQHSQAARAGDGRREPGRCRHRPDRRLHDGRRETEGPAERRGQRHARLLPDRPDPRMAG